MSAFAQTVVFSVAWELLLFRLPPGLAFDISSLIIMAGNGFGWELEHMAGPKGASDINREPDPLCAFCCFCNDRHHLTRWCHSCCRRMDLGPSWLPPLPLCFSCVIRGSQWHAQGQAQTGCPCVAHVIMPVASGIAAANIDTVKEALISHRKPADVPLPFHLCPCHCQIPCLEAPFMLTFSVVKLESLCFAY